MFPDNRVPKQIGDCIQIPHDHLAQITLLTDSCRCPRRSGVPGTSDLPVAIDRTPVKSIDRFKVREMF